MAMLYAPRYGDGALQAHMTEKLNGRAVEKKVAQTGYTPNALEENP